MNDTNTAETTETAKEKRARQLREAKKRQRERERESGFITLAVRLSPEQLGTYWKAQAMDRGNLDTFAERALITGAKFLANAGNVRGGKVRLK